MKYSATVSACAETPDPTESADVPTGGAGFVELTESELDALIGRLEEAKVHGLALSAGDYGLLLSALMTLASVQERLSHNDLTIHKLNKLLGVVRSSEKIKDLLPENAGAASSSGSRSKSKSPRKRKPKPPAMKPSVHHHAHEALSKGQACPSCPGGKLYKFSPAQTLRIVGHAPLSAQRHVCDQLRCNGCGELYAAPLPAEVLRDGPADQQYGFSARSVMAIGKYYAGCPFYRQETLQGLFGGHVAASTIFDQCEAVADALNPVFKAMKIAAAQAPLFYLDDTTNRILQQQPVEKTRGGKTRLRSGIYTSATLAVLEGLTSTEEVNRRIVLFQTNVGHAGEWMDEILSRRESGHGPPIVMRDALSANRVHDTSVIDALCNAHGRRGFAELTSQHPSQASLALEHYRHVWLNDTHCSEKRLSADARCEYHREHSLPHLESLRAHCEQQLGSAEVEENSNLGRAMAYYQRHYEGLSAFCRIPGAPVDNNEIERLIKIIVRNRRNAFFFQTLTGAAIADVITSVLATCNENQVNAFEYLNAVQRNGASVKAAPQKWLPWNFPSEA